MSSSRRAIVVVTEGASCALLRDWCGRGRLPGFAHLLNTGASGSLASNVVPYEPPGLVTAFTGADPGTHGWFSYWKTQAPDYRPLPLTSADLRVPFIWQRPDLGHRTFGVINVFGTHPPLPLNGYLISYPTKQTLRTAYPSDLLSELARKKLPVSHDVSVWFSGQMRDPFVSAVVQADERRGDITLEFLRRGVDCIVVNLTSIDRLSHCYWQELEDGSGTALDDTAVYKAYRCCDRVLQRIIENLGEGRSLLAFSEIGFGALRAYCSMNEQLAGATLLTWDDAAAGRVQWRHTAAFEAVQGTHGVNINLSGRYDQGTVAADDYERCRDDVIDALRAQVNPYTGLPFLREVLRREEVYPGSDSAGAPDLIVKPYDERYLPLGDPYWARHVKRSLQSGWHRDGSYWAGIGPAFTSCGGSSRLRDIFPLMYQMLGEPLAGVTTRSQGVAVRRSPAPVARARRAIGQLGICVAVAAADADDLRRALPALAREGAGFIEVRLDYAASIDDVVNVVAAFVRTRPEVRILGTCRPRMYGGQLEGDSAAEVDALGEAVAAGVWGVDVALPTAEAVDSVVERLRSRAVVVVSHHDFAGTPALEPLVERMRRVPADVCKLAATARTLADSMQLLALPALYPQQSIVAVAMGELGLIGRVLGLARGSCWTYASPDGGRSTAPGQVSFGELRSLYGVETLSSRARIVAAVGTSGAVDTYSRRSNLALRRDHADAVCIPLRGTARSIADLMAQARGLPADVIVDVDVDAEAAVLVYGT